MSKVKILPNISTLIYLAAHASIIICFGRERNHATNKHASYSNNFIIGSKNQSVFCCLYSRLSSRLHCKSLFTLRKLSQLSWWALGDSDWWLLFWRLVAFLRDDDDGCGGGAISDVDADFGNRREQFLLEVFLGWGKEFQWLEHWSVSASLRRVSVILTLLSTRWWCCCLEGKTLFVVAMTLMDSSVSEGYECSYWMWSKSLVWGLDGSPFLHFFFTVGERLCRSGRLLMNSGLKSAFVSFIDARVELGLWCSSTRSLLGWSWRSLVGTGKGSLLENVVSPTVTGELLPRSPIGSGRTGGGHGRRVLGFTRVGNITILSVELICTSWLFLILSENLKEQLLVDKRLESSLLPEEIWIERCNKLTMKSNLPLVWRYRCTRQ